jgi:cytochrome c biogenesis protein CcmG, thiol:disulfide interchange protein DsbE
VLVGAARHSSPEASARVEPGTPAPALAGAAVRGGSVSLQRLRGHVVVMSFLNSRAAIGDPSRAQVVFLRSMQRQHARYGLRIVVVDAAKVSGAGTPSRNDLVNYTYDLNVQPPVAVLRDDGTLARRFGVDAAPTTFLIGRRGRVAERWDAFVPAAQLDFAIRRLEGRSATG